MRSVALATLLLGLTVAGSLRAQPPAALVDDSCAAPVGSPGLEGGYSEGPGGWSWPVLRTSQTHGRAIGLGQPLRGTSWINRPLEFSLETGALIMTADPGGTSTKANDVVAAAQVGWDFDHYWGSQLRVAWSTPDFDTTVPASSALSHDLVIYDASLLYYPWGDSRVRPYYRAGLGLTNVDFADATGEPASEALFTVPLAVGLKYQTQRWMAFRLEAADNIAFGQGEANTMNNFTLTLGAEWRFGGRRPPEWRRDGPHPKGY